VNACAGTLGACENLMQCRPIQADALRSEPQDARSIPYFPACDSGSFWVRSTGPVSIAPPQRRELLVLDRTPVVTILVKRPWHVDWRGSKSRRPQILYGVLHGISCLRARGNRLTSDLIVPYVTAHW
jgi:hypothetical protein